MKSESIFSFHLNRPLLLLAAMVPALCCAAQNPVIQITLTDTTARQPVQPNDTITYKADIVNLTDKDIATINVARSGDANTTFVPSSFESTPIAVPAHFDSLKEDQLVTLSLIGVDPDGDSLHFVLLELPQQAMVTTISSVSNTQASLTYQPNTNFSGTDPFTFYVEDKQGHRDTSSVLLTILPVNDAPNFVKGGDLVLTSDTTEQVFENWATQILAGPADEQMQSLAFLIENNDNPDLFLESPQIMADGTLRFKPALGAIGVAMIAIRLKDDGGIVNGGIDISDIQTFYITLE